MRSEYNVLGCIAQASSYVFPRNLTVAFIATLCGDAASAHQTNRSEVVFERRWLACFYGYTRVGAAPAQVNQFCADALIAFPSLLSGLRKICQREHYPFWLLEP